MTKTAQLLYVLMAGHLPVNVVKDLVRQVTDTTTVGGEFDDPHIAALAMEQATLLEQRHDA
jgi:hypothetical protein